MAKNPLAKFTDDELMAELMMRKPALVAAWPDVSGDNEGIMTTQFGPWLMQFGLVAYLKKVFDAKAVSIACAAESIVEKPSDEVGAKAAEPATDATAEQRGGASHGG